MNIDINNPPTALANNAIVKHRSLLADHGDTASKAPVNRVKNHSITSSDAALLVNRSTLADATAALFDTRRVAELKHTIHTGNYLINPERVAEKLYQFTMELH